MKETFRTHFPLAILAGLCISIGCTVNMKVGGVAGAVLFAFGDCFNGAFADAGTACDATVSNYMCHNRVNLK